MGWILGVLDRVRLRLTMGSIRNISTLSHFFFLRFFFAATPLAPPAERFSCAASTCTHAQSLRIILRVNQAT